MSIEKSVVKRIVCLANSNKNGGRCIAGKVINEKSADWIRPVSTRTDGEVLEQECRYENGEFLQLLDIIDVTLIKKDSKFHQRENWLLCPNSCWKKGGRMHWRDLERLTDRGPLWLDERGRYEKNDRVQFLDPKNLKDSLRLIRVNELTFHIAYSSGRRKMRGKFCCNDNEHDLVVTDPEWNKIYGKRTGEVGRIGDSFLTVSLTGRRSNYCYLLIAGVILCDEVSRA